MAYEVFDGDTVYVDDIRPSWIYPKGKRQKGRDWRKYYRLVHNFSKTYPYALVARKLVIEADSTIAANNFTRVQKEKYVNSMQKELFSVFEDQLTHLTFSQGALLVKLIDREVGKSSYNIIKDYKSGIAARFWQGVAKLFKNDLKAGYDPEGEDLATEHLVQMWESGMFPELYYSIFGKMPPEIVIPSKYM